MIKISIGRRKCRIPTHWEDITLSQCAWLYNRAQGLPVELRNYYLSHTSEEAVKTPADTSGLHAFSMDALTHLADIPPAFVERASVTDILTVSAAILPRFVCGVLGHVDYTPKGRRSFRHHCRRYFYPHTGTDVMGTQTPLSYLSAVELCQVSDVVRSGNMMLAPLALAICCRPRREKYNETKVQRRAVRFASLPVSAYWELWVLISEAHKYLKGNFPECYGDEKATEGGSGKMVMWSDMMVAMAVGNPSALTDLQQMNGYDFVHLMNESIKQKSEEWKMNAALNGLKLK